MLWALGSASCDIIYEAGGTICCGHWILRLVILFIRQGVRFATGIGFCVSAYPTRDKGYSSLRALGFASCDVITRQGIRFVAGIGFCVVWYHIRARRFDLLRALGSAFCDITHETGDPISSDDWVL